MEMNQRRVVMGKMMVSIEGVFALVSEAAKKNFPQLGSLKQQQKLSHQSHKS